MTFDYHSGIPVPDLSYSLRVSDALFVTNIKFSLFL